MYFIVRAIVYGRLDSTAGDNSAHSSGGIPGAAAHHHHRRLSWGLHQEKDH